MWPLTLKHLLEVSTGYQNPLKYFHLDISLSFKSSSLFYGVLSTDVIVERTPTNSHNLPFGNDQFWNVSGGGGGGGVLSLSKTQSAFASQINPSVFLKTVISVLMSKSGNLWRILQDNEHFYTMKFSVYPGFPFCTRGNNKEEETQMRLIPRFVVKSLVLNVRQFANLLIFIFLLMWSVPLKTIKNK